MAANDPTPGQIRKIKTLAAQRFENDDEYRQALNDLYAASSSKALSRNQADDFIDRLSGKQPKMAPKERPGAKPKKYASPKMLGRLKFHAIACAIEYFDTTGIEIIPDGCDPIRDESDIRAWLRECFGHRKGGSDTDRPIPTAALRQMYSTWINRTSNRFLVEGGYRVQVRNENACYYQSLLPDEASYLINRYRAMHETIEAEYRRVQEPAPTHLGTSTIN